jgi:hypothetical protein
MENKMEPATKRYRVNNIPSIETYRADKQKWKEYVKALQELIQKEDKKEDEDRIANEVQVYSKEKDSTRMNRAYDPKEWVMENISNESEHISIYDIECVCFDTCWYQGNTDRLDGYMGSYRLKGTDDILLCDVCFDNHVCSEGYFCDQLTDAIENSSNNISTDDEEEEKGDEENDDEDEEK